MPVFASDRTHVAALLSAGAQQRFREKQKVSLHSGDGLVVAD